MKPNYENKITYYDAKGIQVSEVFKSKCKNKITYDDAKNAVKTELVESVFYSILHRCFA